MSLLPYIKTHISDIRGFLKAFNPNHSDWEAARKISIHLSDQLEHLDCFVIEDSIELTFSFVAVPEKQKTGMYFLKFKIHEVHKLIKTGNPADTASKSKLVVPQVIMDRLFYIHPDFDFCVIPRSNAGVSSRPPSYCSMLVALKRGGSFNNDLRFKALASDRASATIDLSFPTNLFVSGVMIANQYYPAITFDDDDAPMTMLIDSTDAYIMSNDWPDSVSERSLSQEFDLFRYPLPEEFSESIAKLRRDKDAVNLHIFLGSSPIPQALYDQSQHDMEDPYISFDGLTDEPLNFEHGNEEEMGRIIRSVVNGCVPDTMWDKLHSIDITVRAATEEDSLEIELDYNIDGVEEYEAIQDSLTKEIEAIACYYGPVGWEFTYNDQNSRRRSGYSMSGTAVPYTFTKPTAHEKARDIRELMKWYDVRGWELPVFLQTEKAN